MTVTVWRIATDTPAYEADDLSGAGAKTSGGRWNKPGVPVVYASETRALACLETIVHLGGGGLPLNRYLVAVAVPKAVWSNAERYDPSVGWDAEPAARVSIAAGTDWLQSGRSALLLVPSVVVPEELNILINPCHPACASIKAAKVRKWLYDPRLMNALSPASPRRPAT